MILCSCTRHVQYYTALLGNVVFSNVSNAEGGMHCSSSRGIIIIIMMIIRRSWTRGITLYCAKLCRRLLLRLWIVMQLWQRSSQPATSTIYTRPIVMRCNLPSKWLTDWLADTARWMDGWTRLVTDGDAWDRVRARETVGKGSRRPPQMDDGDVVVVDDGDGRTKTTTT